MMLLIELVSALLGWTYTAAWSASFYPQVLLNYQRKSVQGVSIDFLTLNVLGFACYTTANIAFLSSTTVREEYSQRHDGVPSVRWNDVAFSVHALAISLFTWFQSRMYIRDPGQKLSRFNRNIIIAICAIIAAAIVFAFGTESEDWYSPASETNTLSVRWLDLVNVLSSIKVYISFAKYLPQAWINHQRKSTRGWSIGNIILDFTGGTLSFTQLLLDAARSNDWSSVTGNPGKLGISLLSIAFDVVFMVQHYVLYRQPRHTWLYNEDPVVGESNRDDHESSLQRND